MTTATADVSLRPTIVGLGELLWDVFPDERRPGGAPANFAWHANQLGARGLVVSRVGSDQLGDELVAFLDQQGLDSGHVQRDLDQPTSTVSITTTADGQPDYTIHEPVAWDSWNGLIRWRPCLRESPRSVSGRLPSDCRRRDRR